MDGGDSGAVSEAVASGEISYTKARRAAMVERLFKLGGVPTDRAELMLESSAAMVETREMEIADETAAKIKPHKTAQ